ncbi:MAG: hypothetical protein ABJP70_12050 [Erythrobacter sp.]
MSDTDLIARDSGLGRLLDANAAPPLPKGLADRIVARTKDRAPPLPETRSRRSPRRRWFSARRLSIAALGAGALATAAAATGALEDWGVSIPGVENVWASLTGDLEQGKNQALVGGGSVGDGEPIPAFAPQIRRSTMPDGSISSTEELEEAFKRFDRARQGMEETRRRNVDRGIEQVIERRRARGLPVPTPAQEERIRDRIEQSRERRDARSKTRREGRREALREKIENGEEITAEDLRPGGGVGGADRPRFRERVERLRELPPEERRERAQQWLERRQERRNRRNGQQPPVSQEQATQAPSEPEAVTEN